MTKVRGKKSAKFIEASMDGACTKNFSDLGETKALVLVSIRGNEYCAGGYLQAQIKKAVESYKFTTVLISDEVYWHNLRDIGDTDVSDELKDKALALGDDFLLDNIPFIAKALDVSMSDFQGKSAAVKASAMVSWINDTAKEKDVGLEVVRWKDWLKKDDYATYSSEIEDMYDVEPALKKSIDETATDFARRHQCEGFEKLWMYRSKNYLKEESPAVMWCAINRGYEFIVYPGSMIAPMGATKDFFVSGAGANKFQLSCDPDQVGNWIDVNFKRGSGHTITNLNPKAFDIARYKASVYFGQNYAKDNVGSDSAITILTQMILTDDTILPSMRMDVLISLFSMVNEQMNVDDQASVKSISIY